MDALPIDGLSHFQLNVSDLDASVAWYKRALDLTELRGEPGRYIALQSTTGGASGWCCPQEVVLARRVH